MKTVLITGASGFLGKALCKKLVEENTYRIRVLSRNEGQLCQLKMLFPNIEIHMGDIADRCIVKQAMKNVVGVYHLAASKHVGLAEKFVRETVNSNVIGSLNILEESLTSQTLEFLIGISTDKAAQVSGVYGASKLMMERLFLQFEQLNPKCKYRIVRYGNVLYSTGSVLCKWKESIQNGQPVTVTDLNATRFFWSVDQAIDLIFECMKSAPDSKPWVPEMKAMSVFNLLSAMYSKYSPNYYDEVSSVEMNIIGLQPGENLHEKILENGKYSNEVEQYTVEEIKELI